MKAKEYFQKYFAALPEHPMFYAVVKQMEPCFKEFYAEVIKSAEGFKLLRSQVAKFDEADKKWHTIIDLLEKHCKLPPNYRRVRNDHIDSGAESTPIDVNDLLIWSTIFRECVNHRIPAIGKEMGKLHIAADRRAPEQRNNWASNAQEALNNRLEKQEMFKLFFGQN